MEPTYVSLQLSPDPPSARNNAKTQEGRFPNALPLISCSWFACEWSQPLQDRRERRIRDSGVRMRRWGGWQGRMVRRFIRVIRRFHSKLCLLSRRSSVLLGSWSQTRPKDGCSSLRDHAWTNGTPVRRLSKTPPHLSLLSWSQSNRTLIFCNFWERHPSNPVLQRR